MKQDAALVRDTMEAMPDDQGLKALSQLGKQYADELAIQAKLQQQIADSVAITTRLQDITIPEKMNELGLEEIKLPTGEKIALQPVYGASVPDERKAEAWQWLRENHHGSLIKATLLCSFGMGEDLEHTIAVSALQAAGIPYKDKEDVHAATLKAFVKEQYEKGATFPEKLFGAFTKTIAKIKTK